MPPLPLDAHDIDKIAEVSGAFRLLSDPTRCRILCLLYRNKDGMCVSEIAGAVGISHSAASHQLSRLEDHRVVQSFREGQQVCYEIRDTAFTRNLVRVLRIFARLTK